MDRRSSVAIRSRVREDTVDQREEDMDKGEADMVCGAQRQFTTSRGWRRA